jgi:hypothetical protein
MVTRVGSPIQSGVADTFSTFINSGTFNTQVGDLVLVFARSNAGADETVTSAILADGGANTAMTLIDRTNVPSRNTAAAFYKIITTARTTDSVRINFSDTVYKRVVDVIIYRPGARATLSLDVLGKTSPTAGYTGSAITSPINTTGGGVLCTYVVGSYDVPGGFISTSVTAGYTKFGTDTVFTSLAEKFSATALSSETVTWTDSTNPYHYYIAYDVAIKELTRPLITIGDITRSQFSFANNITWVDASANNILGGSWWDSTGYPNGSSAWATQTVTDTDTVKLVSLDVTTLFQAIYDNPDHLSAVIIGATGSGTNQLFAGNTYSDTTKRPKISYDGGADQSITNETGLIFSSSGGSANGSEQYVAPDLGTSANWARWILDVPPPITRPTSATLKVYTTQQVGNLSIKVFWLRYPPELGIRLTEPSSNTFWTFNQSNNTTLSSISNAWAGDAGTLQVQSSVLRADNLNVSAIKSAYLNLSGSTYATVKSVAPQSVGSGGEYRAIICSSDGTYNNGYYFSVSGTSGKLRRNNALISNYTLPNGLNSNFTDTEIKIEKVGSTINMYAGPIGTLSFTASYNDASPISGGFSGFLMAGNSLATPGITAFDAGLTGSIPVSPTVANILNESLSRGIFRGIFRGIS